MTTILVIARRWFNKSCGNTYHSVTCYVDGKETCRIPYAYGYDSQWEETAKTALIEKGILQKREGFQALWRLAEESGFTYEHEIHDVKRKKDL